MEEQPKFRSGFVCLVGRPNAGKSTLLNAIVGEKVAITSDVAQTTRKRLRAVVNTPDSQLVIVDTPGLHKPKDALGKELNRAALAELDDCDVVAMLVDATATVGTGDAWVASHVDACDAKRILVITKADLVEPARAIEQLEAASALARFDDSIVISATEDFNVDSFVKLVSTWLPEGPKWFGDEDGVDASDEELVGEFVREKVLLNTSQEVPHSVGVTCDSITWAKDGHASIECTILVERESQKGIVVGAGGAMIKRIGVAARRDIERLLGTKVYLDLHVEVRPMWRRDANEIRRLGYDAGE
ncbi:MAG: GTPase Era [Atopobiaceae bacterium]|nr:GTPase Era [Atopobiaceae bacterium]